MPSDGTIVSGSGTVENVPGVGLVLKSDQARDTMPISFDMCAYAEMQIRVLQTQLNFWKRFLSEYTARSSVTGN